MILNGATGAIGGVVIQLCAMLKLRAIAVVRRHETGPASDPVKVEKRLKALGAAEVLVETDKMGSVGLKMGAFLLIYLWAISLTSCFVYRAREPQVFRQAQARARLRRRCLRVPARGDPPGRVRARVLRVRHGEAGDGTLDRARRPRARGPRLFPSQVDGRQQEEGTIFNHSSIIQLIRQLDHAHALTSPCTQVPKMLETLAKLVNADKIRVDFTEYELSSEFAEAMEHALEPGKGTKVLLRVNDVGSTYT